MALTSNKSVLKWVDEMVALTKPDKVVWIDGSEEQLEALRAEACSTGEMIKLNEEKLPGCYLHRSAVNDVARVEGRTFICTRKEEDAGPTNNWMDPKEAYEKLGKLFDGAMKGRTMYVIPYCMAHVGSPFAKVGIELTDSIYVVLSMAIMTRIGQKVLDFLGDSDDFVKGLHSKKDLCEEDRYIVHFPEDNTIMSVNSGYGGNVLLGKKCFALRIASYLGKKEGWMAEQRSGPMENRKIKVKSLISVTAWAVALGMFIAYLFLERQWMLFTIDFAILLRCLLGILDPEEDRRSKNVYWILLITRVMDIAIRLM